MGHSNQKCELKETLKILKWCAYDTEFTPNTLDEVFKKWINKGVTTYYSFTKNNNIFLTFQEFKNQFELGNHDSA